MGVDQAAERARRLSQMTSNALEHTKAQMAAAAAATERDRLEAEQEAADRIKLVGKHGHDHAAFLLSEKKRTFEGSLEERLRGVSRKECEAV